MHQASETDGAWLEVKRPGTFVSVATPENSPMIPGRRAFLTYRDLRTVDASRGAMKAHISKSSERVDRLTGWHYHVCEAQFGYMLGGWIELTFEDGRHVRLEKGDSIYIPGGVRHNETALSDDFEILEVCIPADFGTEPCDPPVGLE